MRSHKYKIGEDARAADFPTGWDLLHDPALNKGTAFTEKERDELGIRGLLPPRICGIEEQCMRVLENYRAKPDDLEKYIFLTALQDRNETLFYRVVLDNIEEMMPIIYTPVVGKACQEYGHIFQRSRGIFVSNWLHKGRVAEVLRNWPMEDVGVIVVTDGERILGLGDLGVNGMGIPVGKLSLYTACAGVHPLLALPITLDVGTNNEQLKADPLYIGSPHGRLRGEEYDEFMEEFITATQEVYPNVLIQFEDFAGHNAFRLLKKYRDRICAFNDDIQGTAAVTVAGVVSAMRITGGKLQDQKVLFLGAGEAGTGIGELLVSTMVQRGVAEEEAKARCWFVDSKGLVVKSRTDLAPHKIPIALDHEPVADFMTALEEFKPTVIIGVSGQPGSFTQEMVSAMGRFNEKPIIFALSNPTSKSECTAEQAYAWTEGRAIFASGSPFDPVTLDGRRYVPGQGNNAYIFPAVGLGVIATRARRVTDEMFFAAAKALADQVSEQDLAQGCIYPPLTKIRQVSLGIAEAVAEVAFERGLTDMEKPKDLREHILAQMYEPNYREYV